MSHKLRPEAILRLAVLEADRSEEERKDRGLGIERAKRDETVSLKPDESREVNESGLPFRGSEPSIELADVEGSP